MRLATGGWRLVVGMEDDAIRPVSHSASVSQSAVPSYQSS